MSEEWTFVTHKKRSSRSNINRRRNGIQGSDRKNSTHHYDGAKDNGLKCFFDNGINPHNAAQAGEVTTEKDRTRVVDAILESIRALEIVLKSTSGNSSFSTQLIAALRKASHIDKGDDANKSEEVNDNGAERSHDLMLREIVAYGIGNFATTSSFSAPLLQLACLLFLRRQAASSSIVDDNLGKKSNDDIRSTFKQEQEQVQIYYYEPCILPVERELLETVFHVTVLSNNEFGKLNIESMRQNAAISERDVEAKSLFYMPHCPMRLYCNVLWSHWETLGSTIIFGNSFHSYDERTLLDEKRRNPTNGILRIIPYTNEITIQLRGNRRGDIVYDALNHLESAFNDCNIISFTSSNASNRPDEYFASQDPEDRELSR